MEVYLDLMFYEIAISSVCVSAHEFTDKSRKE